MSVLIYDKEVYGIRCHCNDDEDKYIVFQLQFRFLGEVEKSKIKQLMAELNNESTYYVFQLFKAYSSSNNIFCPNWDENRFFMWVDTELSVIEELLN